MKEKLKSFFTQAINIRTEYLLVLLLISIFLIVGSFSFALFTTSTERTGALNIVTGNLYSLLTSNDLDVNKSITVAANSSKTISIRITNTNNMSAKFNLYYSPNTTGVRVLANNPPSSSGFVLSSYNVNTYYLDVIVNISNTTASSVTLTFGSDAGLSDKTLTFPSDKTAIVYSGVGTLLSKANSASNTEYTTSTAAQKLQMYTFSHTAGTQQAGWTTAELTDYRYVGSNPNNYVTFNGEKWRIIGVFTVENSDGSKSQKIKIIRDTIGNYSWDSSVSTVNSGWGVNEWSQADLMTELNSGAYWNRTSGTCYNGPNNGTTSCDFSSTGLAATAKAMISPTKYYLGGVAAFSGIPTGFSTNFYTLERDEKTCTIPTDTVTRTTSWIGNVALMYPSDYGYATGGGATTNEQACLNTDLDSWGSTSYSDCNTNDWLYNSALTERLLTSHVEAGVTQFSVFNVNTAGDVNDYGSACNAFAIRPVLYLRPDILISGGDGTSSNPYTLS